MNWPLKIRGAILNSFTLQNNKKNEQNDLITVHL